ncbi:MAG: phage tail tape measure protein, partial [Frankiales bacterium]|nr:phage tail tape measure protein [Frankiales bacterium]
MAAAEVEDLAIRLSGETAPFQTSMERAATAGDAAANAAVRAAESTTALSDSAVRASTGINRVADMQLKANATYKEATVFQRELSAAVATTNRANAEQVAALRSTADAARLQAKAMSTATVEERALRDAALSSADALRIQATAASQAAAAASRDGAAQLQAAKASTTAAEERGAAGAKIATGMKIAAGGIALLTAVSLHMAGNFQKDTNVLVTAAGESQSALAGIRKGILEISTGTGTGLHELTDGMYMVEKAGYRSADGLKVLKAAAQGAREENASLAAVTNAMTSVMASYHMGASQSVSVMNALKTAAGESKTTMENYATALSTVIPIASANKIGFDQVAGAIATLTQHGTSAAEATQELSSTIRSLAAPNMVAQKEMAQLGLQANDVSQNLGKRGLTGTVDLLVNAITSHMGHAGTVLMSAFNQSKSAAADANVMIAAMPANVSKLAKEFAAGEITMGGWRKAIKDLPADQASMATQFAALEGRSRGFNDLLKSGSPAAQTFTDALKRMSGGAL